MPVVVKLNAREQRFYDKIRKQFRNKMNDLREKLGDRTTEYVLLLPDLFVLFVRLARDDRVPQGSKIIAGVALAYLISPIDLIPDMIFGLGWLDDVILAVYAVKRLLIDVDQAIIEEHWTGEADLLVQVQEVVEKADSLVGSRIVNAIRRTLRRR